MISAPASACGLYGLGHHMKKGEYKVAPFVPDPKPERASKAKPVFAASVLRLSAQAQMQAQDKRASKKKQTATTTRQ